MTTIEQLAAGSTCFDAVMNNRIADNKSSKVASNGYVKCSSGGSGGRETARAGVADRAVGRVRVKFADLENKPNAWRIIHRY